MERVDRLVISSRSVAEEDAGALIAAALSAGFFSAQFYGGFKKQRISAELDESIALVVLIDEKWLHHQDEFGRRRLDLADDLVRMEIELALESGTPIVPVLLGDAKVPPTRALPEAIRGLTERQFLRVRSGDFDEFVSRLVEIRDAGGEARQVSTRTSELPLQVLDLELQNFRCFEQLALDFTRPSELDGEWTCAAGINGAGKSTILQALALLLIGAKESHALGSQRLLGMRRRDGRGKSHDALLRARVSIEGAEEQLEMLLNRSGAEGENDEFWDYARNLLAVGYGASRNLSKVPDRYEDHSSTVRTKISLFDPMARLQRAEELLAGSRQTGVAVERFSQIVETVFGEELTLDSSTTGELRFVSRGAPVDAQQLPDGFRSSVAWIADLCARWADLRECNGSDEMSGLVLIDEIDLHLHASLQRSIVPRLRKALPAVQFVVTSHSPLILASFDRNEIVALDRDSEGGVKTIDRQVMGLTPDEIYEWLLGTPASSEALEREIAEAAIGSDRRHRLAELLEISPDVDAAEAKARLERVREQVAKLPK